MAREMKHRPAMEIGISGLTDGDYPFAFETPAQRIGLDESFPGIVRIAGTLRKVSTQYFLNGTIQAVYEGDCDRCLTPIHREVALPIAIYYRTGFNDRHPDDDADDVEMVTLAPDAETIELDDDVRQAILLDRPLKMLCTELCLGLCSGCGVDLNRERCKCDGAEIDPRWAKLAQMLKKPDEE